MINKVWEPMSNPIKEKERYYSQILKATWIILRLQFFDQFKTALKGKKRTRM